MLAALAMLCGSVAWLAIASLVGSPSGKKWSGRLFVTLFAATVFLLITLIEYFGHMDFKMILLFSFPLLTSLCVGLLLR